MLSAENLLRWLNQVPQEGYIYHLRILSSDEYVFYYDPNQQQYQQINNISPPPASSHTNTSPKIILIASPETWKRIISYDYTLTLAYMMGLLSVEGDLHIIIQRDHLISPL